MALSADLNLRDNRDVNSVRDVVPCNAADTFFRGAILRNLAAGRVVAVGGADDETFAGIVKENTITLAQDDTVPVFTKGLFSFNCAAATLANVGSEFNLANASDDPADLNVTAGAGRSAGLCVLVNIIVSGVSGWFSFDSGVVRAVV